MSGTEVLREHDKMLKIFHRLSFGQAKIGERLTWPVDKR